MYSMEYSCILPVTKVISIFYYTTKEVWNIYESKYLKPAYNYLTKIYLDLLLRQSICENLNSKQQIIQCKPSKTWNPSFLILMEN